MVGEQTRINTATTKATIDKINIVRERKQRVLLRNNPIANLILESGVSDEVATS